MPKTIWRLNLAISEKSPPQYSKFGPFFPKNILGMSRSPIFWSASGEMSPQKKLLIRSDIKEVPEH
jgi:hypothetical protein